MEYRINKKGTHLIDIAGRSIGGHCSQVLQFNDDVLLEEIILNNAIGKKNAERILMVDANTSSGFNTAEHIETIKNK